MIRGPSYRQIQILGIIFLASIDKNESVTLILYIDIYFKDILVHVLYSCERIILYWIWTYCSAVSNENDSTESISAYPIYSSIKTNHQNIYVNIIFSNKLHLLKKNTKNDNWKGNNAQFSIWMLNKKRNACETVKYILVFLLLISGPSKD